VPDNGEKKAEEVKTVGGAAVTMTLDEWNKKGEKLFGPDKKKWRFKCPCCGNVQMVKDFEPFAEMGAEPNDVTCNCIGRWTHPDNTINSGKCPCNYTSGGLFCFNKTIILHEDKKIPVFEFSEE